MDEESKPIKSRFHTKGATPLSTFITTLSGYLFILGFGYLIYSMHVYAYSKQEWTGLAWCAIIDSIILIVWAGFIDWTKREKENS